MTSTQDAEKSPIFLVGTGRCGSTIFQTALAMHPALAWPSTWSNLLPSLPAAAWLHRIWRLPGMMSFWEASGFPKPAEPNAVFESVLTDAYSENPDGSTVREGQQRLVPYFDRLRKCHGGERLLAKMVGRPVRIALLAEMWPNAFYVDLQRDLKPTATSLKRVDFYDGWGDMASWPWDDIPEDMMAFYRAHGESEIVGIAIGLWMNRRAIQSQLADIPADRTITVGYQEFVQTPEETMRSVCEATGLGWSSQFKARLEAQPIYSGADDKWKRFLGTSDVAALDKFESTFGF